MSKVVIVHGIGKQVLGPQSLLADYVPALQDGVLLAGGPKLMPEEISCAFYGDIFRRPGSRGTEIPPFCASDVDEQFEVDLLMMWWQAVSEIDRSVPSLNGQTRVRTPLLVQRALDALSHSKFFSRFTDTALVFSLRQVRRYFTDPEIRAQIHERVAAAIRPDTRVVVAHSLGSVAAYEVLCSPGGPLPVFVTLGSPLGIRNLFFDRLQPSPVEGRGVWPRRVSHWMNVADRGDVVALVKSLQSRFDGVRDIMVDNEVRAHDARPYLTARETGEAISYGLDVRRT